MRKSGSQCLYPMRPISRALSALRHSHPPSPAVSQRQQASSCLCVSVLTWPPPARWFTKIGHKGCEPHYYRFVLRCHSIINTECDNLPIFVRWRKGRKTGRTAVQWEENGKITWGDDKGIMMFALTLFWDAKKDAYECKPLVLSVERHMRNNKSQCMGVISLDLAEFVNMEAAIVLSLIHI